MNHTIKAPVFPESITEGTIATWHIGVGDQCARDQLLVDIETDKIVLEIVAPADGVLQSIAKEAGSTVASEEAIGVFVEQAISTDAAYPHNRYPSS